MYTIPKVAYSVFTGVKVKTTMVFIVMAGKIVLIYKQSFLTFPLNRMALVDTQEMGKYKTGHLP